ncbi:hypothetical protein SNOG_00910 [Parastagonospora nodorum SN15]|uniref:Uncharacterized protein n=1 Tax=Phaeosphaeria nodorum (strain SN15 / ATCC MYA-4574 / FGSC 10173) TaxID=321614 RepID=Q0V504_PHANO|nr:hypothetical protein SNOG_00910 [Parastagonospora nodorum SN15]EAT92405.1 hypothetical protein SNOG_00910 [Parastagonospora nodorum SN15]
MAETQMHITSSSEIRALGKIRIDPSVVALLPRAKKPIESVGVKSMAVEEQVSSASDALISGKTRSTFD